MNCRHHAGSFADVFKHAILTRVALCWQAIATCRIGSGATANETAPVNSITS
jgi:hypothetical protein